MFTKAMAKGLFFITAILLLSNVVVSTRLVCAEEVTLAKTPTELFLFSSDGPVRSVSFDKGVGESEADYLPSTVQSTVLDLGVKTVILDPNDNYAEIKKVKAGQDIIVGSKFNSLGSLARVS